VRAALDRQPGLELWANASVAQQFAEFGPRVHTAGPGDSFTVPEDRVATLLLPGQAPWHKVSEMIDYARGVAPDRAYAIHDGLLNDRGLGVMQRMLDLAAEPSGAPFTRLEPGTTVEI